MSKKYAKIVALAIIIFFVASPVASIKNLGYKSANREKNLKSGEIIPPNFDFNGDEKGGSGRVLPNLISYSQSTTAYKSDWNIIKYLKDNPNEYKKIWEPWLTKAAIHSIVVSDDMDTIAFGGGYLYDNEIHIYRWNYQKNEYEKAWDSGDQIIGGDVISLDYGDTDNNQLMEIVAGSADGYVYVFEQKHIFDPLTNMESVYELVWKSPFLGPVWSVKVADLDRDYLPEIIAGTWDSKIYMFEYYNHSNYPFTPEHWIEYREVWNSGVVVEGRVFAMETGDFNGNGLPDLLVGTRKGWLYLFENNGTVIDVDGYPFALTQDNSYELIWFNNETAFSPIMSISAGDTDGDGVDEASIVAVTQSVFILDYEKSSEEFNLIKLYYNIKSFEKGSGAAIGDFPVDYWMDWSIAATNVYYVNSSGYILEEPIPLKEAQPELKYMNTAMAGETDGRYSQFLPNSTHNATAILDFGAQEEAVGGGSGSPDFYIEFNVPTGFNSTVSNESIRFFISPDNVQYIELTNYTYQSVLTTVFRLYFDIDDVLRENGWRFVRYLKIEVYNGNKYAIDSIYTYNIEKQLTDVVSTLITDIYIRGNEASTAILFGTIQGNLVVFEYNKTSGKYNEIYNALDLDGFYLGTHIWYIARTKGDTKYPYWIFEKKYNFTGHGFTIYTYDVVDLNYDGEMDIVVGTTDGRVLAIMGTDTGFTYDSSVSNGMFGDINSFFSTFSNKRVSVRLADLLPSFPGRELLVAAKPDDSYYPELYIFVLDNFYNQQYNKTNVIRFSAITDGYAFHNAFYASYNIFFDVADVNNDGLNDIVMVDTFQGNLHLYIQQTSGNFLYNTEYFADVNTMKKKNRRFGAIQVVDFNNDGIADITTSYNGRNGGTYYENLGTYNKPIWVEKKTLFSNSGYSTNPVTNLGFNNYTQLAIWEVDGEYYMMALNSYTNELALFDGDVSGVTTLLFATYPLLEKINMAPISTIDPPLNFGYHIISVWNTLDELKDWTQAVTHSDVDGDGKGEIVVGDFDNNVYIFEHLINNTYKRAFRSQDLYYEYETTISPYHSEELGGLEDFFKMRVWEHARFIEANTDIDGDGAKEIIAVTGLQVFIFEHKEYENYQLEYKISLLNHPLGTYARFIGGITAFTYAGDSDYDGYGEIVLAVGRFLLVYQLGANGKFVETFSYDVYDLAYFNAWFRNNIWSGRGDYYDLPGTGILTPIEYYNISDLLDYTEKYEIRALAVADIDKNGLKEIFLGGMYEPCIGRMNGFLYSIEMDIGTMYLKWIAPENITYRNPINALAIADTDYDSLKELIVGSDVGIDIFESETGMYLRYETSITETPDHPYELPIRVIKPSTQTDADYYQSQDIVALPDGKAIVVFESTYSPTRGLDSEIYYSYTTDYGKTWSDPISLTDGLAYPNGYTVQSEKFPQVLHRLETDNFVTVVWYANVSSTSSLYIVAQISINIITFTVEGSIEEILQTSTDNVRNLKLWGMYHGFLTWYELGLSYVNTSDGKFYIWSYYGYFTLFGTVYEWGLMANYSSIRGVPIGYLYYFGYDISYIGSGEYIMAFVGVYSSTLVIYKSILNTSFLWGNLSTITVAGISFIGSLSYDWSSGLILTYYEFTEGKTYSHKLTVSIDRGFTWREPIEIERYYNGLFEKCINNYPVLYHRVNRSLGNIYTVIETPVADYKTLGLSSALSFDGTFYYSFIAKVYKITYDPKVFPPIIYLTILENNIAVKGVNWTDWMFYKIGSVNELAVGDTDGDSRMEIVSNYRSEGFTVFEITGSNVGDKNFSQVFTFDRLNNTLTDISIGDSNGNGFNEIVVSTEYGNVYSFEFRYYNWMPIGLGVPAKDSVHQPIGPVNNVDYYGLVDGDGDGVEEYFLLDNNQYLILINTQTWSAITRDYGSLGALKVEEVSTPLGDRLLVLLSNNTIHMINPATGVREKTFTTVISSAKGFAINGKFLIVYSSNEIQILNAYYLTEIKTIGISIGAHTIYYAIPAITSNNVSHAVVQFSNGTIITVEVLSETIVWEIKMKYALGTLFAIDGNSDGVDEVIALNMTSSMPEIYEIVVIDLISGNVLNSAETAIKTVKSVEIFNVDRDSYPEILLVGNKAYSVFTTKTYGVIYDAIYPVQINDIFVRDYDGDGLTEMAISLGNEAVVVLTNEYGSARAVLFTGSTHAFPTIADSDPDGPLITLLKNGTFIVTTVDEFSEIYTTQAYNKFTYLKEVKVFKNKEPLMRDGSIITIDLDIDGYDELVFTNGTAIAVYSTLNDSIIFLTETGSYIHQILPIHFLSDISGDYDILFHNGTHFFITTKKGRLLLTVDARQSSTDVITNIAVADFDGDNYDEILLSLQMQLIVYEGKNVKDIRSYRYPIYFITGDYNGDSRQEIAVKIVGYEDVPYNFEIIEYTGSAFTQLFYTTLFGTEANKYLPDILTLDLGLDGKDEVLFFNLTGQIDVFDKSGYLGSIPTGIKNYAIWVGNDEIFNNPNYFVVKYAHDAFRVIRDNGIIVLEVKDSSSTKYTPVDIDGDGSSEYLGITEGKIFAINQSGIGYYIKVGDQTSGVAVPELGTGKIIVVLTDSGTLKFYKLSTTPVVGTGTTTQDTVKTLENNYLGIGILGVILSIATLISVVIIVRRKKVK